MGAKYSSPVVSLRTAMPFAVEEDFVVPVGLFAQLDDGEDEHEDAHEVELPGVPEGEPVRQPRPGDDGVRGELRGCAVHGGDVGRADDDEKDDPYERDPLFPRGEGVLLPDAVTFEIILLSHCFFQL